MALNRAKKYGRYGDPKPVFALRRKFKREHMRRLKKIRNERARGNIELPVRIIPTVSLYEKLTKALSERRSYQHFVNGILTHTITFDYSGKAHGICGPMRSCKTEELIKILKTHSIGGSKVLAAKPGIDTRNVSISSRNGLEIQTFTFEKVLEDRFLDHCIFGGFDNIGIDEGQFVDQIAEFTELMCAIGKNVFISCLDGTFSRTMFKPIVSLIPILDTFSKFQAVCSGCPYGKNRAAPFSALRVMPNKPIKDSILPGDSQYASVCRRCYHDYETKNKFELIN